jgi:Clp amino terminal domain, pathogenicity island component
MGYRGGDLDLRTPQTRGGGERGSVEPLFNEPREAEETQAGIAGSRVPIWVDETLLACCNHAYDVALAHRSGEVRIEHLLYALTRIDDAAEVLEKHGVRDASLRREAGVFIASEIPIAPTNGQATPRRSLALEQALKLAAQQAYPRNRPAGVSDLLIVFTEVQPDLPGLQLLHRNMPRIISEQSVKPSLYPPLSEGSYLASGEPSRRPTRPFHYEEYPFGEAHPYRYGAPHSHADMVHASRLATLEQMVAALREDTAHFVDDFAGRFISLEKFLAATRGEGQTLHPETTERLVATERALIAKLEHLSGQLSGFSDRLNAIEQRVQSASPEVGSGLQAIGRRIDQLDETLRNGSIDGELISRLQQLEALIAERFGEQLDLATVENRLNDIETAILSSSEALPSRDYLAAGLQAFEERQAQRLTGFEQAQAADRERMLQGTSTVAEAVTALSQRVEEVQGARADLTRRLDSLETRLLQQTQSTAEGREAAIRELGGVHEAIAKLNANQHTLAGAIDEWRGEAASDINTVATVLAQLGLDNDAPLRRLEVMSERLDGMYRATVQRYHRRNRFWYWLFGTDDWIGASWPSQSAKIEEEMKAVGAPGRMA